MSDTVHDPVSRVRMAFEPRGENLIVDVWLEPGGKLLPHYHPRQEERWSVVEGRCRFRLGEQTRTITPADGEIPVPPNTVHGLESDSEGDAHLRCEVEPGLRLQEFLEEASAAARDGYFTPRGLPRGMRGTRWITGFLKRYEDETVFVSPPRFVQRALIALFAPGS